MLKIVIPMAGAGSRFAKAGYALPKPLITINGVPMIRMVIENLKPSVPYEFIFICQKEHLNKYDIERKLKKWAPGCKVITVDGLTEGAACTVLSAESLIDNEDELMIANSDQYIDINIDDYLVEMNKKNLDGIIMTMKASDPKWSYVGLSNNLVAQVVEKKVISDEATVGIYNFRRGRDFVRAAHDMIDRNERTNNEFYVAPTYNQMIRQGKKIGIYNIGEEGAGMYGVGIPSDLDAFTKLPVHEKATKLL